MKRNLFVRGSNFGLALAMLLLSVAGWAGIESKAYPLETGEALLQVLPRVQGGVYLIVGPAPRVAGAIRSVVTGDFQPQPQGGNVIPAARLSPWFDQTDGAVFGSLALRVVRLDAMGREVARFPVGGQGYVNLVSALVDSDGSLVILGTTTDREFPVKDPLLPLSIPENGNAFIRYGFLVKTDPAGSGIATSTLIGGVDPGEGILGQGTVPRDLTRDGAGNLYVAGNTSHRDFPVTANAYKKDAHFDVPRKTSEGFLMKVDRHLRSLRYSTFLGSDTEKTLDCPAGSLCTELTMRIRNEAVGVRVGAGQQPWVLLATSGAALPTTPGAYVAEERDAEDGPQNPFLPLLPRESVSLLKLDSQGAAVIVSALVGERLPSAVSLGDSLALLSDGSPVVLLNRGAFPSRETEVTKLLPDASAASAHSTLTTKVPGTFRRSLAVGPDNSIWLSGSLDSLDGGPNHFEGVDPSVDLGTDFVLRLSGETLRPRSQWMLPKALAGPLRATPFGVEMVSAEGIVTSVPYPGDPGTAIVGVRNAAATDVQSTASPYEFLTLEGVGLGLPDADPPQFDRFGNLPRSHEGVRVTLNGVASPLLSVSANAVTLIAPESLGALADGQSVELALERDGQVVARYPLFANGANPRFFTNGEVGARRFAAAVNQDGSVNSRETPAKPGESLSLYLNGAGAPLSPVPAGTLLTAAGEWSGLTPKVTGFGSGLPATPHISMWDVGYFGIAPGLAAGTLQMNVRIPADFLKEAEPGDPPSEAMLFVNFLPSMATPPGGVPQFVPGETVSIWVRR